jgi:hypothetical protein
MNDGDRDTLALSTTTGKRTARAPFDPIAKGLAMSGITQDHDDDEPYPPALSARDEAELDPHDALFAHLTGLCSGALIILGTRRRCVPWLAGCDGVAIRVLHRSHTEYDLRFHSSRE